MTKRTFDVLMRHRAWPCVSVYLPTHAGGFEGQAGRVRLPLIDVETDHYIVAVSENRVRLLKADRWQAREVSVANLPANAREALHYDHPSDRRQFHTALLGRGTCQAIFRYELPVSAR